MLFIYQALIYDDNTQIRILAGHAKKNKFSIQP